MGSLFIESNNTTSSNLLDQFKQIEVYSPIGLNYLIALLAKGSCGYSLSQLSDVFGINSANVTSYIEDMKKLNIIYNKKDVSLTNAIFVSNLFKLSKDYYTSLGNQCEVSSFNFSNYSAQSINHWMSLKTNGFIKNIVAPNLFDKNTNIALLSTFTFKNFWNSCFDVAKTKNMNFYQMKQLKEVKMMSGCMNVPYYSDDNLQLIELPFQNKQYSMGVLLPIQIRFPKISSDELMEFISKLELVQVKVKIPKFKHHCKIDLVPIICSLGITEIFNPITANLSKIYSKEEKNLFVDHMIQEIIIEVDENGVNKSGSINEDKSIKVKYFNTTFTADHPFLYYIRDRTNNCILFMGRYL